MYKIYAYPAGNVNNRQLLYEPGNRNAILLSPKLTREVSKSGSLYFTMDRSHPLYDSLPKMRTVVSVMQDGHETWRGRILNHEADWYNNRVMYCEGALAFLNDSCLTPFNYEGTLREFLQHLLEAHNSMMGDPLKCFELGTVTAALGNLRVHFGDADQYGVGEDYGSTWDIMSKMVLKTFGGYVYVTYNAKTGYNVLNYCDQAYEADRQTAQKIEYGVNLLDLTEKTDTTGLMTRVYPMGNKHTVTETKWYWKILWWGKSYTESHEECYGITDTDSATVNKYLPAGFNYDLQKGYIESTEAIRKFGYICKDRQYDADSDNDTFAAAVQDLQQNHMMSTSYTIKAVDLVDAGRNTQRLDFACFAHIISAPHSVDATMLCTKLVEPLDDPSKKEFCFGMTRKTLTDRQVAALGRTNLLDEAAASSSSYATNILDLLNKYKKLNDNRVKTLAGNIEGALAKMGDLENQLDEAVVSWFLSGEPTPQNPPASDWSTEDLRAQHLGDLYYDKDSGNAYRWSYNGKAYFWQLVRDSEVGTALAAAAAAQEAADGKIRCFTATPTPPYDAGDIWTQGTSGDIMTCKTSRQTGSYQASDWVKASKYTDDTAANQAKQDAAEAAKTATNYLSFDRSSGLTVGHESMPGKKVVISNDAVKVISGVAMVNITAAGIEVTDGVGSCTITSGNITFKGIRNKQELWYNSETTFAAQTIRPSGLSNYSALMILFRSQKGGTWFAGGGNAGLVSMIVPVNGVEMSMVYPWNTVHKRSVTVYDDRIVFGSGYERTSSYSGTTVLGIWSFNLQNPGGDGWSEDAGMCVPYKIYGFM